MKDGKIFVMTNFERKILRAPIKILGASRWILKPGNNSLNPEKIQESPTGPKDS